MTRHMILRVLALHCCLLFSSAGTPKGPTCLTPYMTEVQSWVDEVGTLLLNEEDGKTGIDLSAMPNPVPILNKKISLFRSKRNSVKYLSLARCELSRVPAVFQLRDGRGRYLFATLKYMTFYGNNFSNMGPAGEQYDISFNATDASEETLFDGIMGRLANVWSSAFSTVRFLNLRELDLRACSIEVLGKNLFRRMPSLRALYIGENKIIEIDPTAFTGLNNLVHLDFSRNRVLDENGNQITFFSPITFGNLEKLVSLDFSYTRISQKNFAMIRSLGRSVKSLSLCETGLTSLQDDMFNNTTLQVLDLSRNNGILNSHNALRGLESTLRVISARVIGLQHLEIFRNMTKLEILQLSNNEINFVEESVFTNLSNLQILDLDSNRLTSWFRPLYSKIPKLKFLSLKYNNLNIITEEMIEDIMNIDYVGLSENFMVCNCHAKDLFKMAAKNEILYNDTLIEMPKNQVPHNGYNYYNDMIKNRQIVTLDCDENCDSDIEDTGTIRLVDYTPTCLQVQESKSVPVSNITSCSMVLRDIDYDKELAAGRKKLLALLVLPCVLLPLAVLFVFRRRFRYFLITIRNSAMLSLVNKNEVVNDNTIFNYDVFVSYCNEDRGWVLDHLLPHIEAECNISVCLHERDFQVGLSILENIVSCMDRSKSIMLIISQRFLVSQWCQFEMHLAQHRLLETRREDLTLVLLEEIPRRLRPNTLHYLMLTKTYIVWPKEKSERSVFWRRLKKTLISQKIKQTENVSLA